MQAVQQAYPQDPVELWTTDQHRLGLKPILRRVWSPRGQRPGALVQHRYPWCYGDAFVPPGSGRTWWLLLPTVSLAAFMMALAEVAHALGAGQGNPNSPRAGERRMACEPPGAGACGEPLHFLPPYSPALQPAARLWPLTNAVLANRHFHDLDDRQPAQAQRCLQRQARPEVIEAHTPFHWWPPSA